MPELIGLDFETYGAVNLPTHGLMRYVRDKSFMPLIGSTALLSGTGVSRTNYDFVSERKTSVERLEQQIGNAYIVAHNAIFEQQVLTNLGLHYPIDRFIDSAVVARVAGAGSKL